MFCSRQYLLVDQPSWSISFGYYQFIALYGGNLLEIPLMWNLLQVSSHFEALTVLVKFIEIMYSLLGSEQAAWVFMTELRLAYSCFDVSMESVTMGQLLHGSSAAPICGAVVKDLIVLHGPLMCVVITLSGRGWEWKPPLLLMRLITKITIAWDA